MMKTGFLFAAALSLLATGFSAGIAQAQTTQAQPAQTLPGGATSLKETFDDWIVNCVVAEGQKRCALSQQQTSKETRQLVLAIELAPGAEGKVDGTLVMPFGLAVDQGMALQVDEQPTGRALRFRTCLPVGCLVNLSFNAEQQKALRAGTAIKAAATADGGQEVALSISLKGFAAALDRVQALLK